MCSSQGSTFSTNMAGFVDGSSACKEGSYIDYLPVYVKELIAGGAAGAFAKTAVAALERVKILLQVESLQPSVQGNTRYGNTMEGLTTTARNQGWKQLFAGLSINYIKIVPSVAIGFTAYDMMKVWLHIPPRQKSKSASTG